MIIKSLKKLQERGFIEKWDSLWIGWEKYAVSNWYLHWITVNNDRIFTNLSLDKIEFCREAYWYKPLEWDFPEFKEWDYEALYRVVIKLYELIENKDYNEIDIF